MWIVPDERLHVENVVDKWRSVLRSEDGATIAVAGRSRRVSLLLSPSAVDIEGRGIFELAWLEKVTVQTSQSGYGHESVAQFRTNTSQGIAALDRKHDCSRKEAARAGEYKIFDAESEPTVLRFWFSAEDECAGFALALHVIAALPEFVHGQWTSEAGENSDRSSTRGQVAPPRPVPKLRLPLDHSPKVAVNMTVPAFNLKLPAENSKQAMVSPCSTATTTVPPSSHASSVCLQVALSRGDIIDLVGEINTIDALDSPRGQEVSINPQGFLMARADADAADFDVDSSASESSPRSAAPPPLYSPSGRRAKGFLEEATSIVEAEGALPHFPKDDADISFLSLQNLARFTASMEELEATKANHPRHGRMCNLGDVTSVVVAVHGSGKRPLTQYDQGLQA